MTQRLILRLSTNSDGQPEYLTVDDASGIPYRAYNREISQARQHVKAVKGNTIYDLIVLYSIEEIAGYDGVILHPKLPRDFLMEIIDKVHSDQIQFRHVEFEPKWKEN